MKKENPNNPVQFYKAKCSISQHYGQNQKVLQTICEKHKVNHDIFRQLKSREQDQDHKEILKALIEGTENSFMSIKKNGSMNKTFR